MHIFAILHSYYILHFSNLPYLNHIIPNFFSKFSIEVYICQRLWSGCISKRELDFFFFDLCLPNNCLLIESISNCFGPHFIVEPYVLARIKELDVFDRLLYLIWEGSLFDFVLDSADEWLSIARIPHLPWKIYFLSSMKKSFMKQHKYTSDTS